MRCKAVRVSTCWKGYRCGTPAVPGHKYCAVHLGQRSANPVLFQQRQTKAIESAKRREARGK